MTYSNTNRDKTQSSWRIGAKQVIFYGVLGYIIYSSLVNIFRHYTTIATAQKRVGTLEKQLAELEGEKRMYQKLLEESTSSATIGRNQRQYFGIGTGNDRWIVLPTNTANEKIIHETNEEKAIPNLVKWWKLFTR